MHQIEYVDEIMLRSISLSSHEAATAMKIGGTLTPVCRRTHMLTCLIHKRLPAMVPSLIPACSTSIVDEKKDPDSLKEVHLIETDHPLDVSRLTHPAASLFDDRGFTRGNASTWRGSLLSRRIRVFERRLFCTEPGCDHCC